MHVLLLWKKIYVHQRLISLSAHKTKFVVVWNFTKEPKILIKVIKKKKYAMVGGTVFATLLSWWGNRCMNNNGDEGNWIIFVFVCRFWNSHMISYILRQLLKEELSRYHQCLPTCIFQFYMSFYTSMGLHFLSSANCKVRKPFQLLHALQKKWGNSN